MKIVNVKEDTKKYLDATLVVCGIKSADRLVSKALANYCRIKNWQKMDPQELRLEVRRKLRGDGMYHVLKAKNPYFTLMLEGKKDFEIRKNDRDFHPGDFLSLQEYPYTGRYIVAAVLTVVSLDQLGHPFVGYVCMNTVCLLVRPDPL